MAIAVSTTLSPPPSADSGAGHLFAEHSERIFGYCLRFLGSRSEAEDALQTTFLYAHRALERGVVPELEYPWLHSIAKNVFVGSCERSIAADRSRPTSTSTRCRRRIATRT